MQIRNRLLLLPLLFALNPAASASSQAVSNSTSSAGPVSARWTQLIPRFMKEAAASRRATRAAAAGDSAALRRIAQNPLPMTFNIYTVVSVAQYAAANAARAMGNVSPEVAVASASATVLSNLYKDSTVQASIARELARDLQQAGTGTRAAARAATGKTLGADAARGVIAWAPVMNLVTPWNGTIPTGPGLWYSAPGVPPIGIGLATSRTWLLDSTSQFRSPPPPKFGSPTFDAAVEEVRRVARERTPEQTRIAQQWNSGDPWIVWNDTAAALLRREGASEAQAAKVFAVLNAAAMDAAIACFEAKYHYWTIRPSQVDTTLALADSVPLPNFPSYPSGHACSAGAFDGVLGHFFPKDRARLTAIAEEQAMSRLYAGVHYRFDNDVGLELGRTVARHAIAREQRGGFKAPRKH